MSNLKQPTNRYEYAKLYHSEGIQIIPTTSERIPGDLWKVRQYRPNTRIEIENWFNKMDFPNIAGLGGKTSGNLAFIDHDKIEGLRKIERNPIYQDVRNNTRVSLSANKHLPHLWLRTPYPVRSSKNLEFGYDIKAEGGYIMFPDSEIIGKHKKEQLMMYQFENFTDILTLNEDQIKFFGLEKADEERIYTYNLSPTAWSYIRTGNPSYLNKPSRSEADQHILVWCVGHKWTREQIQELIRRDFYSSNQFVGKYGEQYFEISYRKAVEWVAQKQKGSIQLIQEAEKRISSLSRNIDQKVFAVYLDFAKMQEKTNNVFLSCRDAALRAGVSAQTASRSLRRLQEINILKPNTKGTRFNPSLNNFENANYTPLTAKLWANTYDLQDTILGYDEADHFDKSMMSEDAFRRGGNKGATIGEKGLVVYLVVRDLENAKLKDIILESKNRGVRSNKTVIEKIKLLKVHGLVMTDDSKGYYVNPNPNLEKISERLGTKGKGKRDAELFRQSREHLTNRINGLV